METVLVDTGAVVALLNEDDRFHSEAVLILKEMKKKGIVPLLTNFTLAEIYSRLYVTVSPDAARTWLRHNIWPVERVSGEDEERARDILLGKEAVDITYSDAVSMAVMERLGISGAFTFNRAFASRGFRPLSLP
ncbi:MAG: type II toxin-antitoxin system VapC family toxin [Bacillota bacterium]